MNTELLRLCFCDKNNYRHATLAAKFFYAHSVIQRRALTTDNCRTCCTDNPENPA